MKVSKEDLVGVLVAVERFLDLDADAILEREEAIISGWVSSLGAIHHVTATREFPGEAGTGHRVRAWISTHRSVGQLEPSQMSSGSRIRRSMLALLETRRSI